MTDDRDARLRALELEAALWKLPHRYARALDRRDRAALADLFTPDATFESPPKPTRDFDEICRIPDQLDSRYVSTFHAIHNQTFEIDGPTATGEVYCVAHHHLANHDGVASSYDLRIRYQDRYVLGDDDRWRFAHRRLFVDARQISQVFLPPA